VILPSDCDDAGKFSPPIAWAGRKAIFGASLKKS
jgi:hypothetical protein